MNSNGLGCKFRQLFSLRHLLLGLITVLALDNLGGSLAAQPARNFVGYPYFAFKVENGEKDLRLYVRQEDSILLTQQDDLAKGYFLLNDPSVRAVLDISEQQKAEFFSLFRQLDAKTLEFGKINYQELNEWSFRYRFFAAKEKMVEYYEKRVEKILEDRQKDLLSQHAKRHDAKSQSFVEWLTSDPVRQQLKISSRQVDAIIKQHKSEWPAIEQSESEWRKRFLKKLLENLGPKKRDILTQRFGEDFEKTLLADRRKWLSAGMAKPIVNWTVEFSGETGERKAKWVPVNPGPRNRFKGILNLEKVRKNLELTAEQNESLRAIREDVEEELKRELPKDVLDLKNREAEYHFQDEVERRTGQLALKVLLPHQQRRLKELGFVIQADSPMVLATQFLQQTKMLGDTNRDFARFRVDAEMLAKEWQEEQVPIRKAYRRKLIGELNSKQQEQVSDLLGKSFFEDEKEK